MTRSRFSTSIQYFDSVQDISSERSNGRGPKMEDRNASIPSAQLESELRWTPEVAPEPNPYAVGSVWHTSWGYDQTNVEFYTVVRESKASVWLVPMRTEIRDGRLYPTDPVLWTTGELCEACGGRGYVWADDDGFGSRREDCTACGGVAIVNPEMHRKGKHGTYVRMDYVRNAYPYNGGGRYDTYASGSAGH